MTRTLSHRGRFLAIAVAAVGLLAASNGLAAGMRTSKPFSGAKVNGGTVTAGNI